MGEGEERGFSVLAELCLRDLYFLGLWSIVIVVVPGGRVDAGWLANFVINTAILGSQRG